jgi:hypothetical protein
VHDLRELNPAKDGEMFRPAASNRLTLLALLVLSVCGCDWIPVRRRLDPSLYPVRTEKKAKTERSEPQDKSLASKPPAPLPQLPPLTPFTEAEVAKATAPTPLLDEAFARASLVEQATVDAMDDESDRDPPPKSFLHIPDPEPVKLPVQEPAPDSEPTPLEPCTIPPFDPPGPIQFETIPSPAPAQSSGSPSSTPAVRPSPDDVSQSASKAGSAAAILQTALKLLDQRAPSSKLPTDGRFLEISDCRLCRRVDGFGKFIDADPQAVQAGQPILVYCEVAGVTYTPSGASVTSNLEVSLELIRADTLKPTWRSSRTSTDSSDAPGDHYYLSYIDRLPDDLEPGRYRIRVQIRDPKTRQQAGSDLALTIVP